jgi:hypothetical protein
MLDISTVRDRTCYQRGCAHPECWAANTAYQAARARASTRPDEAWMPFVPAGPVRRHLLDLAADGVGLRQVSRLSGVGYTTLVKLVHGDPRRGGRRSRRLRPATARAVLSISGTASPTRRIPAGPTVVLVTELLSAGLPKAKVALLLGRRSGQLRLGPTVLGSTADAVARVHERVMRIAAERVAS